ncbi:putative ribonuclease H-like domain-containing protein [Tanacetum coccineum]
MHASSRDHTIILKEKPSDQKESPVWTNANRVNHANHFVPRPLQLNAGRPNVNSVRPNVNTGREQGNKTKYSNARTPQQNGVAERMNRTLIEAARTMLADSLLPTTFWAEAVSTSAVTNHAGTSEVTNSAGTPNTNASEEEDEAEELIILQNLKSQEKEASPKGISEDAPDILSFQKELDEIAQKHLAHRHLKTTLAISPSLILVMIKVNTCQFDASQHPDTDDSDMPELKIFNRPKQGIFDAASYDEEGVVTDFNNLPTKVAVSPIPTLRIHNIHPQSQILGDPKSSVQTRSRVKQTSGVHALEEPKKISEALKDESWVEAMQEELLQFRLQQVWILVDLPHGAKDEKLMFFNLLVFVDILIDPKKVYKESMDTEGVPLTRLYFIKKDKKDIMLVQVYVDDIIFAQQESLSKQKTDGIFISQDKYVADMLKKFDLASVKTAITPMETKMALTKDEEGLIKWITFIHKKRSMIGSLMYLTASRPDIMFAVCACSRFQVTPKTSHLNVVKRIFKYLKGKPNLGLWYPRESSFDLEAYSISDKCMGNTVTGNQQLVGFQFLEADYFMAMQETNIMAPLQQS